jgi:hypothetical protein
MPAVPLALAAVVGCRRARPDDAGAAGGPGLPGGACALLVLWIALPLAVFSAVKGQRMNYVEPLVPAAAVLAGVAWSRLGGDPAAAGRLSRAMACASALVLAAFGGILAVAALPLLNNDFALEPGTRALIIAAGLIAGLAGVGSCLLLRRGRAGRAAGTFLAGAAAFWALSVPAIREYEEQRTTRASCRWLRAHIAPDDQVMLYRDYVHSVGFYLGRRVPVAVPTADTRGLAGAWRSWPGRAGPEFTPDEAGLLRAARAPGGVWLIAKPRRERDLVALAREQDLGLEVRRIEPDVFVAHLGPALPEKR